MSPFPMGSFRQIVYISLPLMITSLSGTLMYFADRLILAQYSSLAMNAAASAGLLAAVFQYSAVAIAAIAEVFVGQYNGAKEPHKTPIAVWQMIYFSLLLSLIFIPLGFYGRHHMLPSEFQELGGTYFVWIMSFGFLVSLIGALSAFYIGLGQTKLVTFTAIFANVINVILAYFFIFGIPDLIEPMGIEGAAIATVIAEFTHAAILFGVFISPAYHKIYRTLNARFNFTIFKECLRIGTPSAVGHLLEIGAWVVMFYIVATKTVTHVTVLTIGQTIFILFLFLAEGLNKAVSAISANMIGQRITNKIPNLINSAIRLHLLLMVALSIPMIFFPNLFIDLFFHSDAMVEDVTEIRFFAAQAVFWVWLFCLVDGMTWAISGVLTSAGDTIFIMMMNAITSWFFAVVPLLYIAHKYDMDPVMSWRLVFLYGLINFLLFVWRYKSKRWLKFQVAKI